MIARATVVGGGVIGAGWVARLLENGIDVVVCDPSPDIEARVGEVLAGAERAFAKLYPQRRAKGQLRFEADIGRAVAGAELVVEAVPERLDIKQSVCAAVEAVRSDVPIASSTSGILPTDLQAGLKHPERLFVAHPFNPVYLLPLVEIVGGEATDPALLTRMEELYRWLGMLPLRVKREIPAFIADRLLEAVWREALWLVKDGVATTQDVDEAIRMGFGLRWAQMGLFETYRIAGGPAGMRHFLAQFGPALEWPWTKLMDVPELDDALVEQIAAQSDAQSGHMDVRGLERLRDDNLIAILEALAGQDHASGKLLSDHRAALAAERDP
ncbi:MAG: 3-hydroxyacyl-CoA dehydrogenase NAD-binding domain-containing protein [Pseudomonadota bacterium]